MWTVENASERYCGRESINAFSVKTRTHYFVNAVTSGALTICTEIFGGKFPANGTGIFLLANENRNGIELYHLQNTGKVFAFSGHEAWH